MPSFSQRNGYTSADKAFQRERIEQPLRIAIWNVLNKTVWEFWSPFDRYDGWSTDSKSINSLCERLWEEHFRRDRDLIPLTHRENGAYDFFKKHFFEAKWYEAFDFIEALIEYGEDFIMSFTVDWLNSTLQSENSAYRIIGKHVCEITSPTEIQAIHEALNHTANPVKAHIAEALAKLSDRESPDYRNSIKESISAVEAECRRLTGDRAATLGAAIKQIPNVHPALKEGFLKIYGYTSDQSGIRHALTEGSMPTYADAKFMLSACSAFVSYLSQSEVQQTAGSP